MTDVVVISDDTVAEPEPIVVVDGGSDGDVMDAVGIALVERVTRLEDTIALVSAAVEGLTDRVEMLAITDDIQSEQIQNVAEGVEEVAEQAADAIEETAEDIEEASPEIEPDEIPTTREHPFFRKWGGRR